jgi:hypothetical protein
MASTTKATMPFQYEGLDKTSTLGKRQFRRGTRQDGRIKLADGRTMHPTKGFTSSGDPDKIERRVRLEASNAAQAG